MADFKKAFALTMNNEGGYSNDPLDTGGETYKGVSRNNWPNWPGWRIIDSIKAQTTAKGHPLEAFVNQQGAKNTDLQQKVLDFYKANFWDVNKLDLVNSQPIAEEMFDSGVNFGTGIAAKFLQEALNLCNKNQLSYPDIDIDGLISANGATIKTLNGPAHEMAVLNTMNMLQGERYIEIMRKNKTQERFWQSWLSRVIVTSKW